MTGFSRNAHSYLSVAHNVNPCDHEDEATAVSRWSGCNITSNGHPREQQQFNQFSLSCLYDEELYEVTASTFPCQEYGDISTNWDCQDSSDQSGAYFISHSERCLGNKSAAHFEAKHTTRRISAFPSAEIPLKMVVGNHHSTQQKLHFSRHLLRKRCFRSTTNRCSPGKIPSLTKSAKMRLLEKRETEQSEEKSLVKSALVTVNTSESNADPAPATCEQAPEGDLSQGDRRQIANARERQRVSHLNDGFDKLRRVLPWMRRSRRVSKVDTLRGAIAYIKYLQQQVWARDLTDGCMDCLGAYCLPRSAVSRPITPSFNTCYIKS